MLELDLEGLRRVNAAEGRSSGDRLLHQLAATAREQLGSGALIYRRAGDELAAFLPGSAGPAALALANRLQQTVESIEDGRDLGAARGRHRFLAGRMPTEAADLLERVREASYLAKASGQGVAIAESSLQRS